MTPRITQKKKAPGSLRRRPHLGCLSPQRNLGKETPSPETCHYLLGCRY